MRAHIWWTSPGQRRDHVVRRRRDHAGRRLGILLTCLTWAALTAAPEEVAAQGGTTAAGAAAAPDLTLADFAWMTGEWEGAGPDGAEAEIDYMAPRAGVLPGFFRLIQDDRVLVLEAMTLVEEEDGLFMYVRHFDPALVPMEEERAIRLRLVRREGDTFFFENMNEGQNPVRSTVTRTETGFLARSILARTDGTDEIRVEWRRR